MPRKKNMYKCPEMDIDLMGETTATPDLKSTNDDNSEEQYSSEKQLDVETNTRLFNSMVLQTILSNLPGTMPSFDRVKLIRQIENELGPVQLNFEDVPWHHVIIDNNKIVAYVRELSFKMGFSLEHFLCPPVRNCIECGKELSKNHESTQVVICTHEGLKSASLYQYRCRHCKIVYNYDTYGKGEHKFYYQQKREYVKASRIMFIKRKLMEFWQQLSLHSQVSFESIAICYNATFKYSSPLVEGIFNTCYDDEEDDDEYTENENLFLRTHLNRKQVSAAFWNFLIENTARNLKLIDEPLIGNQKEAQISFMDKIEEHRKSSLLPHTCTEECKQRACDKSTSMDGIWKCR